MHFEVRIIVLNAVIDALFFIVTGVVCDALLVAHQRKQVAGEIVAYALVIAVFVFRAYRYYKYARAVRLYRTHDLPMDVTTPQSELMPDTAITVYSVLVTYILLLMVYTEIATKIKDNLQFHLFIVSYTLAVLANCALLYTDSYAYRFRTKTVFDLRTPRKYDPARTEITAGATKNRGIDTFDESFYDGLADAEDSESEELIEVLARINDP